MNSEDLDRKINLKGKFWTDGKGNFGAISNDAEVTLGDILVMLQIHKKRVQAESKIVAGLEETLALVTEEEDNES